LSTWDNGVMEFPALSGVSATTSAIDVIRYAKHSVQARCSGASATTIVLQGSLDGTHYGDLASGVVGDGTYAFVPDSVPYQTKWFKILKRGGGVVWLHYMGG